MTIAHRRLAATVLTVACSGLLAACGSSSSSHAASTVGGSGAGTARHTGFRLTASEQSCLKKKGVTLSFPGGAGHAAGGRFTKGNRPPAGAPRHGTRPTGGFTPGHGSFSAQMKKRLAALKSCGVSFGAGAGGGPGGGAPSGGAPSGGAPGGAGATTGS